MFLSRLLNRATSPTCRTDTPNINATREISKATVVSTHCSTGSILLDVVHKWQCSSHTSSAACRSSGRPALCTLQTLKQQDTQSRSSYSGEIMINSVKFVQGPIWCSYTCSKTHTHTRESSNVGSRQWLVQLLKAFGSLQPRWQCKQLLTKGSQYSPSRHLAAISPDGPHTDKHTNSR